MSVEENKVIVHRFFEVLNKQDLLAFDDYVTSDYLDHTNQFHGLDNMKQAIANVYKGFPDFHVTIEDIIAEDDKVWIHSIETGTHSEEFQGIAPTSKKLTFTCVDIFKIVDGKIAEAWHVYDILDFYLQLNVIEYTEAGKHLPRNISKKQMSETGKTNT
jgi:steroid delta-isomerase-like uncharacterized protein